MLVLAKTEELFQVLREEIRRFGEQPHEGSETKYTAIMCSAHSV